jgi:hypothetical protein
MVVFLGGDKDDNDDDGGSCYLSAHAGRDAGDEVFATS